MIYFVVALIMAWRYSDRAKATGRKKRRAYQAALLGWLTAAVTQATVQLTMAALLSAPLILVTIVSTGACAIAGISIQVWLSNRWIPKPATNDEQQDTTAVSSG